MKKIFGLMAIVLLTGCKGAKDVAYFQDATQEFETKIANASELRAQPDDKVTILVNSSDPQLADLFNLPIMSRRIGSNQSINGNQALSPYTVDKNGQINFPVLGKVDVLGKTRIEIAETIEKQLKESNNCRDAVVTVEFDNMYINVLGEVNKPGRYQLTQDHITILDALGMAGDLAIQGKRTNVKVTRKTGDIAKTYELNLDSLSRITMSPAFYMKQGDVVYVEPNDYRKRQTTVNGNNVLSTGFWISLASLLMNVILLITR